MTWRRDWSPLNRCTSYTALWTVRTWTSWVASSTAWKLSRLDDLIPPAPVPPTRHQRHRDTRTELLQSLSYCMITVLKVFPLRLFTTFKTRFCVQKGKNVLTSVVLGAACSLSHMGVNFQIRDGRRVTKISFGGVWTI